MVELTAEQREIETQIEKFIRAPYDKAKPYFRYQGLAGTGKSVLLAHLARKYPKALLCAFTGKAASVIARKSNLPASTIHAALYCYYGRDKETRDLKFGRKVKDGEWTGNLVLVDEVSTVNEWLAGDLLATGCKVVACGDAGQLPPVRGDGFFMRGAADAELHTVHRQAWDSAIIRQAHAVRAGHDYRADGPDFRIEREIGRDDLMAADVVLCWRNATRIGVNRLVRGWKGLSGFAERGEAVMALQNNPDWGILNGATYLLQERHVAGDGTVCIVNERGEDVSVENAWIEDMEAPIVLDDNDARSNGFAWAYCATVHKYQGSESDRVILVDEYNRDMRDRWLYTGITRAAKQLIVQRFW